MKFDTDKDRSSDHNLTLFDRYSFSALPESRPSQSFSVVSAAVCNSANLAAAHFRICDMRIGYARVSTDNCGKTTIRAGGGYPAVAIALKWPRADVIGLFSNNVVSFSRNVVLRELLFSINVV